MTTTVEVTLEEDSDDTGVRYCWDAGARGAFLRCDPEKVQDELHELHKEHGHVPLDVLLEKARNPDHVAHQAVEWDDQVAATEYRFEQLRHMLRSLRKICITQGEEHPPHRVFIAVKTAADQRKHQYQEIDIVIHQENGAEIVLNDAIEYQERALAKLRDVKAILKEAGM